MRTFAFTPGCALATRCMTGRPIFTEAARNSFFTAYVPSLKKYASEIGLDRARFDAALDRGVYAAEVKKDIEDGEMYGVGSTPTIFINGVQLRILSAEGLREAIDRAARSTK